MLTCEQVAISFPLVSGSEYNLTFDPLFAPIDVTKSSYDVKSTKVEIKLRKQTPGQKWPSLEGVASVKDNHDPTESSQQSSNISSHVASKPPTAQALEHAPAYPTSSKTGPKNWDKLADDLTKKPKKTEKKPDDGDDGDQGDANDLDYEDEGDPVNSFFKKLYKDADPDTRRAMMKSYQESNGTALSTNWAEVGKGKVETSPPEGMEAKRWGE